MENNKLTTEDISMRSFISLYFVNSGTSLFFEFLKHKNQNTKEENLNKKKIEVVIQWLHED